MNRMSLNSLVLVALLFSLSSSAVVALAETKPAETDNKNLRIPIEGGIVQRLEKAGLHPVAPKKIEPSEGFKMPEVPKAIQNENLSVAGQVKMDQIERKRSEGKLTDTEHDLEKDSLFRDANLRY